MDLDQFELQARRGKYEQIAAAQAMDAARMAEIAQLDTDRAERVGEALGYLDALRTTGDGAAFANEMEHWCRRPGFGGFKGPSGQMFLKQLLQAGEPGESALLLALALTAPDSDQEAQEKVRSVLDFVDRVKANGHPAPARTPFLLSFFWSLQDPTWPVAWSSAAKSLFDLGWYRPSGDHDDDYVEFATVVRGLGDPVAVGHALFWLRTHRFVGLDPALIRRCEHARALALDVDETGHYRDAQTEDAAIYNTTALIYDLLNAVHGLQAQVSSTLGRNVKVQFAKSKTGPSLYRWWGWASWAAEGGNASLRLWATSDGVVIGLHPGHARAGWYTEAGQLAEAHLPPGYEFFQLWEGDDSGQLSSTGSTYVDNEFLVGRLLPGETGLDRLDLADDIVAAAADLQGLLDLLYAAADAGDASAKPEAVDEGQGKPEPAPTVSTTELALLVAEFKTQRGSSLQKDEQARADRAAFADYLRSDELEVADPAVLRQIINTRRYGSPGPQSVLNATINGLDADGLERFYRLLGDVLWGGEPAEQRLDRALSPEAGFRGLGESVLIKLLSITDPKRFLPVFPYRGEMGKAKLMRLIGLTPPDAAKSRGERQVEANDAIRQTLDPLLPDPWLQAQFLYWLKGRAEGLGDDDPDGNAVGALAAELFIEEVWLSEWLELLREKKQLIFYGPPGTGKTYVAQKLARLIAGDPSRHQLVQFHPSTSYEDFFEGFRPETTADGQLSYRLVHGPLARIAALAADSPGVDHVMVIDEINRANLPKVLGELLFLLEYRDEQVQTLYRPDDAFELPSNLLFIGTMNTADKSIALIDAALRRRFHFVPYFPHEAPHDQVLAKWLQEHNPDAAWVAGFVEDVNSRLVALLGGPHLQIGASHFFDKKLDRDKVARIWRYSVYPFIEDQLWGQSERLRDFEFERAHARYLKESGEATADEPAPPPSAVLDAAEGVSPDSASPAVSAPTP